MPAEGWTRPGGGASASTGGSEPDGTPLAPAAGCQQESFGAVQALADVDLDVHGRPGHRPGRRQRGRQVGPDQDDLRALGARRRGRSCWQGQPVHLHGPKDAEALGITTIYQDLALCDNLDIVQNMFLGHELLRHGLLDEATMEIAARETLEDLSVTTVRSIRQPVASLSGGQRQSVAVAKAVMSKAKLVIMDEPTAALGVAQTAMVLGPDRAAGRAGASRCS